MQTRAEFHPVRLILQSIPAFGKPQIPGAAAAAAPVRLQNLKGYWGRAVPTPRKNFVESGGRLEHIISEARTGWVKAMV
jgi:hypothetical protein